MDRDGKELAKFEFAAEPLGDEKAFEATMADYIVFDMPLRKPSCNLMASWSYIWRNAPRAQSRRRTSTNTV